MSAYTYIHSDLMPTRTVSITEDAYEVLASKKGPSESFSDVILKISGKASLIDIAGILTKKEGNALRKSIAERRKAMREGMERRAKRLVR